MSEPNLDVENKNMVPKFNCITADLKAKRHQLDGHGEKECYKQKRTRSGDKKQPAL